MLSVSQAEVVKISKGSSRASNLISFELLVSSFTKICFWLLIWNPSFALQSFSVFDFRDTVLFTLLNFWRSFLLKEEWGHQGSVLQPQKQVTMKMNLHITKNSVWSLAIFKPVWAIQSDKPIRARNLFSLARHWLFSNNTCSSWLCSCSPSLLPSGWCSFLWSSCSHSWCRAFRCCMATNHKRAPITHRPPHQKAGFGPL